MSIFAILKIALKSKIVSRLESSATGGPRLLTLRFLGKLVIALSEESGFLDVVKGKPGAGDGPDFPGVEADFLEAAVAHFHIGGGFFSKSMVGTDVLVPVFPGLDEVAAGGSCRE